MTDVHVAANPFGMMLNPEAIIDAMNRSDRLDRLQRRVYRPLDKPMIPKVDNEQGLAAADAEIDNDVEIEPEAASASASDADARNSSNLADMSDVIAVSRNLAY